MSNAGFQNAGDAQAVLDGFQGLVGGHSKPKTIEQVDLVELLRRRVAIGHVADLGELFIDDLGLQPGGGKAGLERHLADINRPAGRFHTRTVRSHGEQLARQLAEMVRARGSPFPVRYVLLQGVGALQQDVGHGGRKRRVRLDQMLQQVLHQVGQLRDPIQSDGGGRALDLVGRAHQHGQIVAPARVLAGQQRAVQAVERRLALVDEDRKVLFGDLLFVDHVGQRVGVARRAGRGRLDGNGGLGQFCLQGPLGIGLGRLLPFDAGRLEQPADGVHDGGAIDRLAPGLLQLVDQRDELIESHEDQFGHVAVDDQLVLPGRVENVLDLVGQRVDVGQSKHGRQSLEAVGRAEHLVEQIRVARLLVIVLERVNPFVQLEQPLVELRQELIRLVEKVAQKAIEQIILRVCLQIAHCVLHAGKAGSRLFPFPAAICLAVDTTTVGDARNP